MTLRRSIERNLAPISVALLIIGCVGWCWLLYSQMRSSGWSGAAVATAAKSDLGGFSSHARSDDGLATGSIDGRAARNTRTRSAAADDGSESAGSVVARDWSFFDHVQTAERGPIAVKPVRVKPPVRVASLDSVVPTVSALHPATDGVPPSSVPFNIAAKTSLVDFETAPFPYRGRMPGSGRAFLNGGQDEHRGHVNFRGRVLWENKTYSDDRVLLHIPPGFDPQRPAVMVVFFHGHGATLARDVRDRQKVPDQITAAGINAVLVAPQFAVDAADSSAGKFWEPNGFKRFLDEASKKLAGLYGDQRSARAFANMPIVIVAYSGGFGPTLSVLDRGGVRSRIRGLVLLDALYGGMNQFADWISNNRSAFFVSSYTPHTAHRNAELEHLLSQRSVAYGSVLRRDHLPGMVTFLPAGPVSHRDFVTHAWANNPIKDILVRMDDVDPKVQVAGPGSSGRRTTLADN